MLDFLSIIAVVLIIWSVGALYFRLGALTSATLGFLCGSIVAGLLCDGGGFEDFDSNRLAERRLAYDFTSLVAVLLLIIHFGVHLYRNRRRRDKNGNPAPS